MKLQRKNFKKKSKNEYKSSDPQQEYENEVWNDENSEGDNLNADEKFPKWYEEFPATPERVKDMADEEIATVKEEAKQVLKDESAFYHSKNEKRKHGSDQAWIKTVLQKGTASDKVAAHVLKIQESPAFNLSSLVTLINMVRVSKKEFSFVIDALAELFISDLLPPNIKLRHFERQPLDQLGELSSGNAMTRRKRLAFWAFEDELKRLYIQMIQSLNIIARDSVEVNKDKAVSILYRLLASHPEQEDVILSLLVNKLGDPSRKVVSKVSYSLNQLLRVHEGMKQVVMNEVEHLLFRPNVNVKAQYYAICFLSQFNFTINDDQVACNIISIYFSFFKACVKKGDINSRMLCALLMGLNRAYPFAKKKLDSLTDHINTLYKLVHLANFNISLHCLIILFQISDSSEDRFFCALYRKLSDLSFGTSAHQAMFINLLYKAFMADNNIGRIKTFIKRVLQLCGLMPVPLSCGLLYLVSQLIHKRKVLKSNTLHSHLINEKFEDAVDDDGEEHYIDVDKQTTEEYDIKKDNEVADEYMNSTINVSHEENIKKEDRKDSDVLSNIKEERKPCASWYHSSFKKRKNGFDPLVRNPSFAEGELAVYTELVLLTRHFHPTVALFASNILEDKVIIYTGDPLTDFTLVRFIERFVFKNPKKVAPGSESKGPDPVLAPRKYYTPSGAKALPTNSRLYLEQNENDVPIDELFLFRYLRQRQQLGYKITKREDGDDSDNDSVASEEFEEMLNSMMSKKSDIDFADDIGDNLSKKNSKKSKRKQRDEGDIGDDEDDIEDDEEDIEDDEEEDLDDDDEEEDEVKYNKKGSKSTNSEDEGLDDESDIDLDDIDDSDAEVMDFDESDEEEDNDDDDDEDDSMRRKSRGSKVNLKKLKNDISGLFAPAEQFSEMLEEAGTSGYKVGTPHALSNKDRAAQKQLDWEMKRNDSWMSGKKRRKQNNFKSSKRRK